MSEYLPTPKMAKTLGYSTDYLLRNRGVIFFEGKHFFSKDKRIDWKVSEMTSWIENNNISDKAKEILDMVS